MENSIKRVSRGDIYYASLGDSKNSVQNGFRPVMIIQNETGNAYSSTVIVAAVTSHLKKTSMPTHVVIEPFGGLTKTSMVMLEQIMTISKSDLSTYVGNVSDECVLREINKALRISLEL